jgi:hypothetical protein
VGSGSSQHLIGGIWCSATTLYRLWGEYFLSHLSAGTTWSFVVRSRCLERGQKRPKNFPHGKIYALDAVESASSTNSWIAGRAREISLICRLSSVKCSVRMTQLNVTQVGGIYQLEQWSRVVWDLLVSWLDSELDGLSEQSQAIARITGWLLKYWVDGVNTLWYHAPASASFGDVGIPWGPSTWINALTDLMSAEAT